MNSRSANVRWNAVQAKRFGLGRIANRSFPIGLVDSHTFKGAHAPLRFGVVSIQIPLNYDVIHCSVGVLLDFTFVICHRQCSAMGFCCANAILCFALPCLALDLSQHTESTELNNKVQTTIKDVDDDDGKHVNNA